MLLAQLGLLAVLLPLCCFAPGFFFVRKLRWNPLEKLCASIGLSLTLLYLVSWAIYCAGARGNGMPVHAAPFAIVSAVCAVAALLSVRDMRRLFRARVVRRALAGFGFLLLWTGLLVAIIRNFSGGTWFGDWLEHFQRSLFFLRHFPADIEIFPGYSLPARPPMLNVVTAFFLAQTADRFEVFQAVFAFLNLLLFLPCYLMMPALGKGARRRTALLVLLFASSPLVMQNITYSWTKAAAAFFIVLALWFYLAGWRKGDSPRIAAAFIALAAGLLVHYSAGPYILILTLHYLIAIFPSRPQKWRELTAIAAVCGLLLGTWLVWSFAVFGSHTTLASNSSVTSSQAYQGSASVKIAANLFDSIVPVALRDPSLLDTMKAQRSEGVVRDWAFVFYQVNALFGMGVVGGPMVLWLLYRTLRGERQLKAAPPKRSAKRPPPKPAAKSHIVSRPSHAPAERRFWLILIAAGLILGIAVVGERDPLGVAHLTLLSLQALGLTMLAAVFPWRRRALAILLLAGCAIDFSLGVWLQARVESLDNTPASIVFPGFVMAAGEPQLASSPDALSHSSWNNWFAKHQLALRSRWLADMSRENANDPAFRALIPQLQAANKKADEDDRKMWQGWFSHHGGEVEFLGDHIAGSSGMGSKLALGVLVILFLGLIRQTRRQTS